MKKALTVAAIAATTLMISTPAHAWVEPTNGSWVGITPTDVPTYESYLFDSNNDVTETFEGGVDTEFGYVSQYAEISDTDDRAFFIASGELYSVDLALNSDAVDEASAGIGGVYELRGLAVDESTGTVYELLFNNDSVVYTVMQFNANTDSFDVVGDLESDLALEGLGDFDVYNGELFIVNFAGGIEVINLDGLDTVRSIQTPADFSDSDTQFLSTDLDGNIHLSYGSSVDGAYVSSVTSDDGANWDEPIVFTDGINAPIAWWSGPPSEDESAALAQTGVDTFGMAAASAALLAAGAVVTVRRRARR